MKNAGEQRECVIVGRPHHDIVELDDGRYDGEIVSGFEPCALRFMDLAQLHHVLLAPPLCQQRRKRGLDQQAYLVDLCDRRAVSRKVEIRVLRCGFDGRREHGRTGARATAQLNECLGFEYSQSFPQRGTRDAELRKELPFRGQRVARAQVTGGDLCTQPFGDEVIELRRPDARTRPPRSDIHRSTARC